MVGEDDLREALPILARRNVPLLVHAEDPAHLSQPRGPGYQAYLSSRPPEAEVAAIQLIARLSHQFDARVHIVHVASEEAAAAIACAKDGGARMTAETCPHYLSFAAAEIADAATEYKCAPPIREARHRDALWAGLRSGVLDLIATDHSPAPPAMKRGGDFSKAWGGIASIELLLPAVWTGARVRGCSPIDLAKWLGTGPALLASLHDRKGAIRVGADADLVVWDPDAASTVDPSRMQQRHKLTPYAGRTLDGVVRATYLRGERVWSDGHLTRAGRGAWL
jgi:allantoinase